MRLGGGLSEQVLQAPGRGSEMEAKKEKGAEFDPGSFIDSWIGCWKEVILRPQEFFDLMLTDGGYRNPLFFALISWVIGGVLSGAVRVRPASIVLFPVAALVGLLIVSAILYLSATLIVRGTGSFEGTFRVGAYASALSVFTWVPIVGPLIGIYGIYLMVVGIERVHNLTTREAVIVVVLPIIVLLLVFALLALAVGMGAFMFMGLFGPR